MNNTVLELSNSLTSSTRLEMMLIKVLSKEDNKEHCYFVEYPTNVPPNPNNLKVKGNTVVEINKYDFSCIFTAFKEYRVNYESGMYFLHPPSFIYAFMYAQGVNLTELGIFT